MRAPRCSHSAAQPRRSHWPPSHSWCSAGYVAVASTGDASKCTQAGFTGTTSLGQLSTPPLTASYTFPANSPTGKYTCYTVSVPKNSCLGSTVYVRIGPNPELPKAACARENSLTSYAGVARV